MKLNAMVIMFLLAGGGVSWQKGKVALETHDLIGYTVGFEKETVIICTRNTFRRCRLTFLETDLYNPTPSIAENK